MYIKSLLHPVYTKDTHLFGEMRKTEIISSHYQHLTFIDLSIMQ